MSVRLGKNLSTFQQKRTIRPNKQSSVTDFDSNQKFENIISV